MDERVNMSSLGLKFCAALQNGKRDAAVEMLPYLHERLVTYELPKYFATLKNVLSTAIRKRDIELFDSIVEGQKNHLQELLVQSELQDKARDFVDFLVFTVCDRRILKSRSVIAVIVESYTRGLPEDKFVLFWNEWTSLIARIARRQWQEETDWLLKVLLHQLWRRNDVKICQKIIWQLQMHVAMYCRFDSFEGMLKMYRILFQGYMHIIAFAGKAHVAREKRHGWLLMALRGFSEMIMQLARVQMLEEQEVYQDFYKQRVEPYDESTKQKKKWLHLLQLSITYWAFIHYKKGRRQAEYLKNILDPYLVNDEYRQLIEKM